MTEAYVKSHIEHGINTIEFFHPQSNSLPGKTIKATITNQPKTYVLQDGEGLWDVAVKFYGDGFKWTEIAKANHMENNADNVNPGTRLIIPSIK